MSFMTRLQNSWHLFTQSLTVMREHKKLLFFPAVTAALTVLIILFFIAPIVLQPTGFKYTQSQHWKAIGHTIVTLEPMEANNNHEGRQSVKLSHNGVIFFTIIYFVAMFLATFFSVAFYHEILRALNGQDVSVLRGLRFASTKISSIFIWSLFAGLIGYMIRILEEKVGILGKIILGFIGIAWSVASVFVIPFIIAETSPNPFKLLRKSAGTLKKTWGESLIGYVGIRFGIFIIILLSFLILAGTALVAIQLHSGLILLVALVLWFISLFALAYLTIVANHIYRCALYVFAADGIIPAPFDQAAMQLAWKMKQ